MKLLKGLAFSFAVIAAVTYGLAIYSDPEGFWESFRDSPGAPAGEAKTLEAFVLQAVPPTQGEVSAPPSSFVLLPPSEEAFDPTFLAYRGELKAAVEARNLEAVLALASPDVLVSLDGEQGRLQLGALLEAPDDGEVIWQIMEDILALPSHQSSRGDFCAPYVSCGAMPEGAEMLEPFETAFTIKPVVAVRAAPSTEAVVVTSLSFQSVQLATALEDPLWAEVILESGETGFVARSDIWLVAGARAEFAKEGGAWRMKSFLSGS
ncbi:MAG: SH3 domain-containing protein [Alphaproteobacteria bacterium]|nr:MAG: SH3 domain-containing protein [Alphaproteobacteria bacterium]